MDFAPSQVGASASARPTAGSDGASSREKMVSSDFETFLRMLTTQMQNQDPLNPMEATDFAVQLATFSGVEQAVRTNQLLENLMSQSVMGDLAGLIGKMVRSPGPARFDGTSLELTLPPASGADSARLIVRDRLGGIVDSTEVSPAGGRFQWRGLGPDGMSLPDGDYSFEIAGYRAGVLDTTIPVETYTEVIEIRREGATNTLVLAGGHEVAATDITALRASP